MPVQTPGVCKGAWQAWIKKYTSSKDDKSFSLTTEKAHFPYRSSSIYSVIIPVISCSIISKTSTLCGFLREAMENFSWILQSGYKLMHFPMGQKPLFRVSEKSLSKAIKLITWIIIPYTFILHFILLKNFSNAVVNLPDTSQVKWFSQRLSRSKTGNRIQVSHSLLDMLSMSSVPPNVSY